MLLVGFCSASGINGKDGTMKTLEEFLADLPPEKREAAIKKFLDAINSPPEPTEALKELFRKYGRFAKDQH